MGFLAIPLDASRAVSLRVEGKAEQNMTWRKISKVLLSNLAISPASMEQSLMICSQDAPDAHASAIPANILFINKKTKLYYKKMWLNHT